MMLTRSGRSARAFILPLGLLACSDDPVGVSTDLRGPQTSVTTAATSIVIGAPGTTFNNFPFGRTLSGWPGTRFQQAYAAAEFNSAVPILIDKVSFLSGSGELRAGTYTFYLSTITAGLYDLSSTDFDANRGADNVLFATVSLSGDAPATLTITGLAPFPYDPAQGNLLLDIVIAPSGGNPTGTAAAYAQRDPATDILSRYHNFGFPGAGAGLVTQFGLAVSTPNEPDPGADPTIAGLLAAVQQAIEDGSLVGHGAGNSAPQGLTAWVNMLHAAQRSFDTGNEMAACAPLLQAHLRADGASPPQDFVTGAATPALATSIQAVRGALGCK